MHSDYMVPLTEEKFHFERYNSDKDRYYSEISKLFQPFRVVLKKQGIFPVQ